MEHVVFFPAHDGSPAFRRLTSLDDAVRFVEHLRNVEGVDLVSVHALTEVPLSFRPYYKVEVPGEPALADAPVAVPVQGGETAEAPVEAEVPVAAVEPALVAVPEREQASEPARASMGFFSRG